MQLHDLDGRAERLEALLRDTGGFRHVYKWQEVRFRGSSLWMLFAWR